MRESTGDLWEKHKAGFFVVIPVNLSRKKNGHAVMGAGLALDAAKRFPDLPVKWGRIMDRSKLMFEHDHRLILFPTKKDWRDPASFDLIQDGAIVLQDTLSYEQSLPEWKAGLIVYLPRLGCGCGRASWPEVFPVLNEILDERFIVLSSGASH